MSAWAVVVAAGAGTRLGGGTPKALRILGGRPMLAYSIDALRSARDIEGIVVVGPEAVRDAAVAAGCDATDGGATRQASVLCGLQATPSSADLVLVHDAARPLVTRELVAHVLEALEANDAVVPCLPVADTLKRSSTGEAIEETVSRDGLWRAQTPQGFRRSVLLGAHERALRDGITEATDDSALVERIGVKPFIVTGDERNVKVTTPGDLRLAEALLESLRP